MLGLLAAGALGAEASAGEASASNAPDLQVVGQLTPSNAPRSKSIPAALRVGFALTPPAGAEVPQLSSISLGISRRVTFETKGLPGCPLSALFGEIIWPTAIPCEPALVGRGTVTQELSRGSETSHEVTGHVLAFYAREQGRPRVLVEVRTGPPLSAPTSYVIPFDITQGRGEFPTRLTASNEEVAVGCRSGCFLPELSHISSLTLALRRSFVVEGKRKNFVGATCPAPGVSRRGAFRLVSAKVTYAGGGASASMAGWCQVTG